MATMTISEAEHIINITVAALLEEQTSSNGEDQKNHFLEYYCHKPISTLQGYDVSGYIINGTEKGCHHAKA